MKIRPFEIENFVASLKPYKNPILLYGPDNGLVSHRTKNIINTFFNGNKKNETVRVIDNKQKKSTELNDAINTKSLFSTKEVLRIINPDDKMVDELKTNFSQDSNLLIIINAGELTPRSKLRKYFETSKEAAIIACYNIDSVELRRIIIKFATNNNLKIEDHAIEYMVQNLENNYQIILNELEKLLLIDEKFISYILIKNILSLNNSIIYEDIILDCLSGSKKFFNNSFESKMHSISAANSMILNIKTFLLTFSKALDSYNKKNLSEVVEQHLPKYLFKKKAVFANIIKNNSKNNILESLKILSDIEIKIRKNQTFYKMILLRGMLNISRTMN